MKLSVEVSGSLEIQLTEAAKRLNLSPEEVVVAGLRDLVARADDDFDSVARRIIEKNRELYKRLA